MGKTIKRMYGRKKKGQQHGAGMRCIVCGNLPCKCSGNQGPTSVFGRWPMPGPDRPIQPPMAQKASPSLASAPKPPQDGPLPVKRALQPSSSHSKRAAATIKGDVIVIDDDDEPKKLEKSARMSNTISSDLITWQTVTVSKPPRYTKGRILDIILENVDNNQFIPSYCDITNNSCYFLINNCESAIKALKVKNNVCQPADGSEPLQIVLGPPRKRYSIQFRDRVISAIESKRTATSLNLQSFYATAKFENFYFPLGYAKNQEIVANMILSFSYSTITNLVLSKNKIMDIDSLDLVKKFPKLRILDLSDNLIKKISKLTCCRGLEIKSLSLEGNPLCSDYIDPNKYIKMVKLIFPRIIKLDGVILPVNGIPEVKRNYTCDTKANGLIDRFLEIYYPLFDGERKLLDGMYNENSIFTFTYRDPQSDSKKVPEFLKRSRNLIKTDKNFMIGNVHTGVAKVVKCLCALPKTQHDPYSFTVDVLSYIGHSVSFVITGVVKLPSENLANEEPVMEFSRTFILVRDGNYKYTINNDMLSLIEPSQDRLTSAFKVTNLTKPELTLAPTEKVSPELQENLIKFFKKLTDLDDAKSKRCLVKFEWKFKEALEYFVCLMKKNAVDSLNDPEPAENGETVTIKTNQS